MLRETALIRPDGLFMRRESLFRPREGLFVSRQPLYKSHRASRGRAEGPWYYDARCCARVDARITSRQSSSSLRCIHPSGIGVSRRRSVRPWSASHPPWSSLGIARRNSVTCRRSSPRGTVRRSRLRRRSTLDG